MAKKWQFRDVSTLIQTIRQFLLGRKHTLHVRFPAKIAPRTIPPPDIPRGPDDKYSNQYYFQRNAMRSVMPPVVAPVAEDGAACSTKTGRKAQSVCLPGLPTPGSPWCWDGHSYYECIPEPDYPPPCPPKPYRCPPPPPKYDPCEPKGDPPCPLTPDKMQKQ